jgi:hypothetical protein
VWRGWRRPSSKPDAATGESSAEVSVDASACPVVRSVREQCRQVERRSANRGGEKTIEQLEQCRLVLRTAFRFVEHGGAGEYLAPNVSRALLLPRGPLFLAYAGLKRRCL